MIDAIFVERWSKVYELRAREITPSGWNGEAYVKHLPNGLRRTAVNEWGVEQDLFRRCGGAACLSRDEFLEVCYWKSARIINTVAKNSSSDIAAATTTAYAFLSADVPDPAAALDSLMTSIVGVRVPVASAIMTVAYPDKSTVFDTRALWTLYRNGCLTSADAGWARLVVTEPSWPASPTIATAKVFRDTRNAWWRQAIDFWANHYDNYLTICKAIIPVGSTLRDLDRALWSAYGATNTP